jgi:cytochrome c oxidase assembly protein subunit 15
MAWKARPRASNPEAGDFRLLAGLLLGLILFQAALGMWTVTLKLKPIIVMAHLLGGMATFSLLLWLTWGTRDGPRNPAFIPHRLFITVGLVVLVMQLALGGWTSANYSALACPDFPTCQGKWWPETDFGEAFVLWRTIGVDYEGGVLDLPARVSIHLAHRIGAVITLLVLGLLALRLAAGTETRKGGLLLGAVLLTQITLGILNVVLFLPLPNAVAHNGVGALLLATVLWLLFNSQHSRR